MPLVLVFNTRCCQSLHYVTACTCLHLQFCLKTKELTIYQHSLSLQIWFFPCVHKLILYVPHSGSERWPGTINSRRSIRFGRWEHGTIRRHVARGEAPTELKSRSWELSGGKNLKLESEYGNVTKYPFELERRSVLRLHSTTNHWILQSEFCTKYLQSEFFTKIEYFLEREKRRETYVFRYLTVQRFFGLYFLPHVHQSRNKTCGVDSTYGHIPGSTEKVRIWYTKTAPMITFPCQMAHPAQGMTRVTSGLARKIYGLKS